jgi:undecaprenyl phosphate-alpha-L-ara4N flippase subunit ArnE
MAGLASFGSIIAAIGVFAMLFAFRLGGQGSIIFPIIALGLIVSVPLSFIFFHEPITMTKLLGLGFGVTSIIFLTR